MRSDIADVRVMYSCLVSIHAPVRGATSYDDLERSIRSDLGTHPVKHQLHVKNMNISEHGVMTITAVGTFQILPDERKYTVMKQ